MNLPLHLAANDEPMAPVFGVAGDGPDMRAALPVETMLSDLRALDDDPDEYIALWRQFMTSVGLSLTLHYERDGQAHLTMGCPCDAQVRHRSRWLHFLVDDLKRIEGRRDLVLDRLQHEGRYIDERPVNRAVTLAALRGFIRVGGRILVTPEGKLTEGGGVPRQYAFGTDDDAADCLQASQAYFEARKRLQADELIKRVVRMLGCRTNNGWSVLEARSHQTESLH